MCLSPVVILRDEVSNSFPCGKCEKCITRRISGWSFRLMQEEKKCDSSYFLTLTYEPDKCPITKNGFMDLSKRHLQLFFKRLRKAQDSGRAIDFPLRYYAAGEYGGRSKRPHYHVILFNAQLQTLIGTRHADMVRNKLIELDGKDPFVCQYWPNGHVTLGQVNNASVGYTMKYISKKGMIPMHRNDDRQPEFALMSKRLGKAILRRIQYDTIRQIY